MAYANFSDRDSYCQEVLRWRGNGFLRHLGDSGIQQSTWKGPAASSVKQTWWCGRVDASFMPHGEKNAMAQQSRFLVSKYYSPGIFYPRLQ